MVAVRWSGILHCRVSTHSKPGQRTHPFVNGPAAAQTAQELAELALTQLWVASQRRARQLQEGFPCGTGVVSDAIADAVKGRQRSGPPRQRPRAQLRAIEQPRAEGFSAEDGAAVRGSARLQAEHCAHVLQLPWGHLRNRSRTRLAQPSVGAPAEKRVRGWLIRGYPRHSSPETLDSPGAAPRTG